MPVALPRRFPVIAGPTAGGKSELAFALAAEFDRRAARTGAAEIVSADAFQVYRGMDIGTAKPTPEEQARVRHHLIDIVDPSEPFTVSDWLVRADAAVADIRSRANIPIVVGGTHLYVKAFLDGLFEGPAPDPALRDELRAMPAPARRAELERVDPAAAARIHPADERRTVRALEVFRQTGRAISDLQTQWSAAAPRHDCLLVCLDWPTDAINHRINARVKSMMDRGLLDEARRLAAHRPGPQAGEALGYKQLFRHLDGDLSLEDAVEQIKVETRRFAKNQRTWLKRLKTTPGAIALEPAGSMPSKMAQSLAEQCFMSIGGVP